MKPERLMSGWGWAPELPSARSWHASPENGPASWGASRRVWARILPIGDLATQEVQRFAADVADRNSAQLDGLGADVVGDVVVRGHLAGPLEPEAGGEGMQFVVGVGVQVRPVRGDPAHPCGPAHVVDEHGHAVSNDPGGAQLPDYVIATEDQNPVQTPV
jgi:hypothetical protein